MWCGEFVANRATFEILLKGEIGLEYPPEWYA
jgi:hypothetical protein